MGLFSFVGKALKGISKVAGFVPGVGGTISKVAKVAGGLLDHKKPMAKPMMRDPRIARGNVPQSGYGAVMTPQVLRQTPIMPGGAISTPSGMRAPTGSAPPIAYGSGSSGAGTKRRKRSTARRTTRRAASRKRTSTRSRRLKFGSKAWRAKYMKKRRR